VQVKENDYSNKKLYICNQLNASIIDA